MKKQITLMESVMEAKRMMNKTASKDVEAGWLVKTIAGLLVMLAGISTSFAGVLDTAKTVDPIIQEAMKLPPADLTSLTMKGIDPKRVEDEAQSSSRRTRREAH